MESPPCTSPGNLWDVRSKGVAGMVVGMINALVCTDAPVDNRSAVKTGPVIQKVGVV